MRTQQHAQKLLRCLPCSALHLQMQRGCPVAAVADAARPDAFPPSFLQRGTPFCWGQAPTPWRTPGRRATACTAAACCRCALVRIIRLLPLLPGWALSPSNRKCSTGAKVCSLSAYGSCENGLGSRHVGSSGSSSRRRRGRLRGMARLHPPVQSRCSSQHRSRCQSCRRSCRQLARSGGGTREPVR